MTKTDIYNVPSKSASVTMTQRTDAANRWREQYNPLRGLTLARAVSLAEASQRGQYPDLMWLYAFIEESDATPFALVERRTSALQEMDYNIKIDDSDLAARNQTLADEQQAALREQYDGIDNVYEAIEHLSMASFRMFAIAQPHRDDSGSIRHIECLDQWNFLRDGMYGDWYWNPESKQTTVTSLPPAYRLDPAGLLIRAMRRHIDRIALAKFIRKNMGEKDWAAFLEIYGIPGVFIIGPQNIPTGKETEYEDAALDAAEGGSGYLPYGSTVQFADSPRGVNPFRDFITYCDQQLVLAGTGGLLTMLAESGTGTLAGGAHSETFKTIASGEARKISELFQRQLDKPLLAAKFPGKPILAYFEIAANEEQDVGQIFDHAVKASQAGYMIDLDELSEKTGYKLALKPAAPASNPFDPATRPLPFPAANRVLTDGRWVTLNRGPDNPTVGPILAKNRLRLAAAQQRTLEVVARPLQELFQREAAGGMSDEDLAAELTKIRDSLPAMLTEMNADPETAVVMAEMMAEAFAQGAKKPETGNLKPETAGT